MQKALWALAGFAKALKVKYQDIEFDLDIEPEEGLADSGNRDDDLTDLLSTVGAALPSATRRSPCRCSTVS